MDVIIPGGISDQPEPRDAQPGDRPASAGEAAAALEAWKQRDAEHLAERDRLVRAAASLITRETPAGPEPNIRRIAAGMGISRSTVYSILQERKHDERTATGPEVAPAVP